MFGENRVFATLLAFAITLAPLLNAPALAQSTSAEKMPIIDYQYRFVPAVGQRAMVVGPERLATEIGLEILRSGGNAIDAAVAAGFALAVSYPRAGNLAGGGFMLIHLAKEQRQTLIDYRETAPETAMRDLFLKENGSIDRMKEFFSHASAGVPGTVDGLLLALDRYGTMTREQVLAPAIRLAEKGFPVSFALHYELDRRAERLGMNPEAKRLFLDTDGSAPVIGAEFRQKDLAWTLRKIAEQGRDGFYKGEVAQRIVAEMQRGNGLISLGDLARYKALEREPVRGVFRDFEVVATPPPSSGGIHIIQMLNILENYDLQAMGHNSADYLHVLVESMKRAYADRSEYLGDPDFVDVPTAKLLDKKYAARLAAGIDMTVATPSSDIQPGLLLHEEGSDTTHYTVVDPFGNVVSNTYTLNFSFGSHVAVPGTGMLLNNEMADFAAQPGLANAYGLMQGEANAIEPSKRPLSSMTPTMVLREGKPWLATGSPGGSVIITTVLQLLLNAMEFDMNVSTAAAVARLHHQWMPDQVRAEQGISPDTLRLLRARGHKIEVGKRTLGRTQSVMLENGYIYGATDSRRPGGWVAAY
ncbi:MAG: gamma-glutamyltransferase [Congregibacter sp.]